MAEEVFFVGAGLVLGCLAVEGVAAFVAVSSIAVTRRFVLSLKTLCTISPPSALIHLESRCIIAFLFYFT